MAVSYWHALNPETGKTYCNRETAALITDAADHVTKDRKIICLRCEKALKALNAKPVEAKADEAKVAPVAETKADEVKAEPIEETAAESSETEATEETEAKDEPFTYTYKGVGKRPSLTVLVRNDGKECTVPRKRVAKLVAEGRVTGMPSEDNDNNIPLFLKA